MGKLTALAVKAAKSTGSYQDGNGLMLVVKPSGSRSWVLRIQVDGKRRDFGLGSLRGVGLAEAREKAEFVRRQYRGGVGPAAAKKAALRANHLTITFAQAAEQTDFAGEVVEAALAHTIANRVEAAYRRTNFLEKRRSLMRRWSDYLIAS